jgi:hypothetical protein
MVLEVHEIVGERVHKPLLKVDSNKTEGDIIVAVEKEGITGKKEKVRDVNLLLWTSGIEPLIETFGQHKFDSAFKKNECKFYEKSVRESVGKEEQEELHRDANTEAYNLKEEMRERARKILEEGGSEETARAAVLQIATESEERGRQENEKKRKDRLAEDFRNKLPSEIYYS